MIDLATLLAPGWAEPVTFVLMVAAFALLAVVRRWPIGPSLLCAAWIGAAANGDAFPLRHLVEGAFAYLDPILVIGTAMILMRILAEGGALTAVGDQVERRLANRPLALLPILMLIGMFPGMITGSSTAAVLTTGAMAAPILIRVGLDPTRAGAFIAMAAVLGMVAPPINIPAMIIGAGIDLPYSGFDLPLALVSAPVAMVVAYMLGWPLLVRRRRSVGAAAAGGTLPPTETHSPHLSLVRALAAPLLAVLLMAAPRVWPGTVPDPGLPLVFVTAAAVAVFTTRRFRLAPALQAATEEALPVLAILVGVGGFIQVMTATGARGWLVSLMVGAPAWAILGSAAVSMPVFGAVSAFGSASVLGVPYLLVLLGRDEVVTTAALSQLASLGDLMLPAALVATLAARVVAVDDRMAVLRRCFLPALLAVGAALAVLFLSPEIGRWL